MNHQIIEKVYTDENLPIPQIIVVSTTKEAEDFIRSKNLQYRIYNVSKRLQGRNPNIYVNYNYFNQFSFIYLCMNYCLLVKK